MRFSSIGFDNDVCMIALAGRSVESRVASFLPTSLSFELLVLRSSGLGLGGEGGIWKRLGGLYLRVER